MPSMTSACDPTLLSTIAGHLGASAGIACPRASLQVSLRLATADFMNVFTRPHCSCRFALRRRTSLLLARCRHTCFPFWSPLLSSKQTKGFQSASQRAQIIRHIAELADELCVTKLSGREVAAAAERY